MLEKHYTEYVEDVKALKRIGDWFSAEQVLLELIEAVEKESAEKNWGVAPWYYQQLAIVYRRQERYSDEVSVLERYAGQKKAPGVGPSKLEKRLESARRLLRRKCHRKEGCI
jgi:hypothetical protein